MKIAALRRICDHERRRREERQRACAEIEVRIDSLSGRRRELRAERERAGHHLQPALYEQYLQWCEVLDRRAAALDAQIGEARQRLEAARRELLDQHRRVRSIEHLHERARTEARRRSERCDARSGDEQAVRNWSAEVAP